MKLYVINSNTTQDMFTRQRFDVFLGDRKMSKCNKMQKLYT
jgi:hypothetical protein